MFGTFFRFEMRYWLRGMMVWVFLLVLGALFFGASSSDNVTIGGALGNTYRNAPWVVQNYYSMAGILSLLMTTAFVQSAATREFVHNLHQIVFTAPFSKWAFLLGRFWGSALVAIIPLMAVSFGSILATFMPWNDPVRWGSTPWMAHLMGILSFAIPNTLFVAAILFSVAMLTRSTMASFLGGLVLLVGYGVSSYFTDKLDNEPLAAMLDPFGVRAFVLVTKYWTVAEKNTLVVYPAGLLLWNRVLWLAAGAIIFVLGGFRFSFAERASKRRRTVEPSEVPAARPAEPPSTPARVHSGMAAALAKFRSSLAVEFVALVRSTVFIVLLAASLLNVIPSLVFSAREAYGNSSLPVTYTIVNIIRGTLYLFIISILTFFAGSLVWKERESRFDEISDTLPAPDWVPYASKFLSLLGCVALVELVCVLAGIGVQTYHHYTRYQIGLYLSEIFFWDFLTMIFLATLAFFIHVLAPNKYAGYFAFIALMLANVFGWRALDIESHLVQFASTPSYTYSDMFGYGAYIPGTAWFNLYWTLVCVLLAIGAVLLWPRGKDTSMRVRFAEAVRRWRGPIRPFTAIVALLFLATGVWAFYNTKIDHELIVAEERKVRQADYEKTYRYARNLPHPRTQSVRYRIDIFPEKAGMTLHGEQLLKNLSGEPVREIHVNVAPQFETELKMDRAALRKDDRRLRYRIYELNPPLQPGESMWMRYTVRRDPHGFENELSVAEIQPNGTFFNSGIVPQLGYLDERELADRNDRRKKGLPEKDLMQALERNCTRNCADNYLGRYADWVDVETNICTSPDQIAVAPGSLLREWTENGRRCFHYKLDQPSLNFYSFISARYEVAREDWNGVKMEVYYHPEHKWNVPKMLNGIRKALEYCSANFAPYPHRQARIIEFPRIATFAQAFPGTMPYSEAIGFIADLHDPEDIDQVLYIVAHEIAHQWWAHQVVGADMQGATLLSETQAQYSALMTMEKQYGRDMMRKFLEYEMDRYLRGRGRELLKERPLLRVESGQGYIHYNKGSVVMYYLREMIGEEAVNRALHSVMQKYRYAAAPYPTSYVLLDALREQTPTDLQYLLKDLFEDITLFSNRTLEAKAVKRGDGRYDVTIDVESKKYKADEKGVETEVPVSDSIEIGAFSEPPKGKKYGRTLHRERVKIRQTRNRYSFTTAELPQKAGIDPFSLLVDRVPADNLKKVDLLQ
jgi:hypothetical protein